ncbi:ribokinase/fructokinase [Lucifera butyrica]|uniref:Ribokinase n=1 Tax=Lucifera butyrica TaxID=1351585 RepID=A0A498R573_9FIRM|nr:ribokinase [Lucifera butyrica]VBB05412.1 ribokinase/fructokinase [Lucifera butyrica]
MMQKKAVLVIGSLNMDLVAAVEKLPAQGETVFGKTFSTFPGGKGANQAVAAAKLGVPVTMAGCLGQDGFAGDLIKSLTAAGIDTSCIRYTGTSTGTALITVGNEGMNTIVVIPGANACCNPGDVDRALAAFDQAGILVVQHEVPPQTVEYAIRTAKGKGWTVILNPAPARTIAPDVLALIDIITPNETEIASLTGCKADGKEAAVTAAGHLLAAGVGTVVVTLGAQGAVGCTGDAVIHVSACPVTAVDTTAAGDAYTGALAAALAEGKTLAEGMRFAAAVAALAVTKEGAQPALPWREEADAFIRQQGESCNEEDRNS